MNEDRGHERRRQEIGRRLDRDREFSGNTPLTDADGTPTSTGNTGENRRRPRGKRRTNSDARRFYDTAASGIIAGTIGGVTVAAFVGMAKWIGVHFARFFGTG